jgi:hypothetical protein
MHFKNQTVEDCLYGEQSSINTCGMRREPGTFPTGGKDPGQMVGRLLLDEREIKSHSIWRGFSATTPTSYAAVKNPKDYLLFLQCCACRQRYGTGTGNTSGLERHGHKK